MSRVGEGAIANRRSLARTAGAGRHPNTPRHHADHLVASNVCASGNRVARIAVPVQVEDVDPNLAGRRAGLQLEIGRIDEQRIGADARRDELVAGVRVLPGRQADQRPVQAAEPPEAEIDVVLESLAADRRRIANVDRFAPSSVDDIVEEPEIGDGRSD